MEEIIKELGVKIDSMKNETVSKTELIEVMSKIKDLETKGENVATFKANIEEIALRVLELETKGTKEVNTESLKSILESKKEQLAQMKEKSGSSVQFTLKAAGTMALSTNTTGQIPQAEREAGITRIVRRNPFILELVNVGTIMSNVWEWVEQKNLDGGAAMTAEGAAKSQADFDLVVASANVKKVTAYIKITK